MATTEVEQREAEAALAEGDGEDSNTPAPQTSRYLTIGKETVSAGFGLNVETATIVTVAPAGDRQIRLDQRMAEEDIAPLFDGSSWAGTIVWDAALVLVDEVIERQGEKLKDCHVLELGCGLGLPGMVTATLGAQAVLTDVTDVLELLERNVRENFGTMAEGEGSCRAAALDWNAEGARALMAEASGGRFDLVLCCDCVYEPLYGESWKKLAECLDVLLEAPETRALISVTRRNHDGIDRFLERCQRALLVEKLCEKVCRGDLVQVYGMSWRRSSSDTS